MTLRPAMRHGTTGIARATFKTWESEDMNNLIGVGKSCDHGFAARDRTIGQPVAALFLAVAALAGCSSSSSPKPQVVSIAVTDADGNVQPTPLTSLAANTGIYLDVTLTNDTSSLGADWTVACGSAPAPGTPLLPGQTVSTVCGTFTPVHTLSAPVPEYVSNGLGYVTLYTAPSAPPQGGIVTLYAAAAADPSRYASLAFPILGLPISVGFAPQPPASLAVDAMTSLKVVVSNDYTPKGVTWSVVCGSSSCGSFSPGQTASGVATTYMAPSSPPTGGNVTITATSVTDPTKAVSATIGIAPVAVNVAPATLSVATDGTGLLDATVVNDVSNAGVDWSLTCLSGSACGSITAHTASGAASTYTAPSAVPDLGMVTVTATSTADKSAIGVASITVTSTATPSVSGTVRGGFTAGLMPVGRASMSLYVAGESGYGSAALELNDDTPVSTDDNGRFTVASDMPCPSANSLLYLIARGGNAGGGTNQSIVLMAALGHCNQVASRRSPVVLNEATTVSAAFALSAFMRDAKHIGAPVSNHAGLAKAFATANEIVDTATGEVRARTLTGDGTVPQAEINTLADVLNRCVVSAGGKAGDGTACGDLFLRTRLLAAEDTLQAALSIVRSAPQPWSAGAPAAMIFELAEPGGPFGPGLTSAPEDWMLRINYPDSGSASLAGASPAGRGLDFVPTDNSGNEWLLNQDGTATEIVGAAVPKVPSSGSNR